MMFYVNYKWSSNNKKRAICFTESGFRKADLEVTTDSNINSFAKAF
jgi:hypothetical protein